MTSNYIKFASYYVIFNDETGGCSVKFYDKEGSRQGQLYFSWEKCLDKDELKKQLDGQLDPLHKFKLRPKVIKIYESNLGRTIGYFDKNDNLIYYAKYNDGPSLDDILSSDLTNVPIDVEYLKQTKNVTVVNDYDNLVKRCTKIASGYWNKIINYF